jgi:hypothetical protein
MAGRQYPWVLADVAWSPCREYTRGTHWGLPLLSWGLAPTDKLATRRQLAAMGLRPNGQEPVAYMYFRYRPAHRQVLAELFLISGAAPKRTATPAQRTALAKANLARRICRECGRDAFYVTPREWGRRCESCWAICSDNPANQLSNTPDATGHQAK